MTYRWPKKMLGGLTFTIKMSRAHHSYPATVRRWFGRCQFPWCSILINRCPDEVYEPLRRWFPSHRSFMRPGVTGCYWGSLIWPRNSMEFLHRNMLASHGISSHPDIDRCVVLQMCVPFLDGFKVLGTTSIANNSRWISTNIKKSNRIE